MLCYNRIIKRKAIREGEIKMRKATYHHTALTQGYVSVKVEEGIKVPYSGRFGEGYKVLSHNPNSTRFCFVSYYIYE